MKARGLLFFFFCIPATSSNITLFTYTSRWRRKATISMFVASIFPFPTFFKFKTLDKALFYVAITTNDKTKFSTYHFKKKFH